MKVIDKINLKIIEVENYFIECSVCRQWKPKQDYCNDKGIQTRTNCYECYSMTSKKMEQKDRDIQEYIEKNNSKIIALKRELEERKDIERNCLTVEKIIEQLKKLPKGSKVIVTQSGYYCDSKIGYVKNSFEKYKNYDNIFVIGHGGSDAYC